MSIEIKFRAWHKNNKSMCENVTTDLIDREYLEFMQYTGLQDKNNNKIYEGDILRLDKGTIRTVFSVPGGFAMESSYMDLGQYNKKICVPIEGLSDERNAGYAKKRCEIIGNIYENPELLIIKQTLQKKEHKQ